MLNCKLSCVRNVGRSFMTPLDFQSIGKSTLERKLTLLRNVGRPPSLQTSPITGKALVERSLISVRRVEGPSLVPQNLMYISEFILERSLIHVKNVERPSPNLET